MKYIIFELDTRAGMILPIVFPAFQDHGFVAQRMGLKPLSAGFCDYTQSDKTFFAYGKSVSLGLHSRLEDSRLLTICFSAVTV